MSIRRVKASDWARRWAFHGVFNFWRVLSDEELVTSRAPRRRCRRPGLRRAGYNLVDLKRLDVARELVTRRLASAAGRARA